MGTESLTESPREQRTLTISYSPAYGVSYRGNRSPGWRDGISIKEDAMKLEQLLTASFWNEVWKDLIANFPHICVAGIFYGIVCTILLAIF